MIIIKAKDAQKKLSEDAKYEISKVIAAELECESAATIEVEEVNADPIQELWTALEDIIMDAQYGANLLDNTQPWKRQKEAQTRIENARTILEKHRPVG